MLKNPFNDTTYSDQTDSNLIAESLNGSKNSLELLIKRHQPFIYNIVWKMVLNPQNAEDITQDILLKVITKLPQFQQKSQFRTWLYRITVNHVLNVKKQFREWQFTDFDTVATTLKELPDNPSSEALEAVNEDVKISCTAGMLLCLTREQRIVFILGAIFNINSKLGAEILETSSANFRQRLSRAKKDLYNFMHDNCGLINKANPCRCPKKTRAFTAKGWTTPDNLQFNTRIITPLYASIPKKNEAFLSVYQEKYQGLFSQHPLQTPLKGTEWVTYILQDKKIEKNF